MTSLSLVVALAFLAQSAPAEKKLTPEEVQQKVYQALMASAGAIDACNERYLVENPTESGKVELTATIIKDGTVPAAQANSALPGGRDLRPCLEKVAKSWKLPPIHVETEKLSLTVNVKKGVKFKLRKPGEKEAPGAEQPD